MRDNHLLKHWSVTQKVGTLTSGEAELYGIVKGATKALGIQSYARDVGLQMALRVHTDSAAAIGICRRAGIGNVPHLTVVQLWFLDCMRSCDFCATKGAR